MSKWHINPENQDLLVWYCKGKHTNVNWKSYQTTWAKMVKTLCWHEPTSDTEAEWDLMDKAERTAVKSSKGGWIAGKSSGGHKSGDILSRSCLVLDVDEPTENFKSQVRSLGLEGVIHQTHTPGRYRVVWPFAHEIAPERYPAIARSAMAWLPGCDPTSAQINRIGFYPTSCSDTPWEPVYMSGKLLDPDNLPKEWTEAFTTDADVIASKDTASLIEGVRTAAPGSRNNTLSLTAYTLLMRNEMTPEIEDRLAIAAYEAGMSVPEVRTTIESAYKGSSSAIDRKLHEMFPSESLDGDRPEPVTPEEAASGPVRRKGFLTWAESADFVEPRELWRGMLPLGSLVIVSGMGGIGKSTLDAWLAAKASRGDMDGDVKGPLKVLMVMDEDDWNQDTVPRLFAAGADLSKVAKLNIERDGGITGIPTFPDDITLLKRMILENDIRFVILDVITSMMAAGLKPTDQADVRRLLNPLLQVAQETDATILCVNHWRKQSGDISQMISGSAAYRDTARCVWAVVRDKEGRRFVTIDKYNRSEKVGQTFEFKIASAPIPGWKKTVGVVSEWRESTTDVQAVLDNAANPDPRANTTAEMWLMDYLDECGEARWSDVVRDGDKDGFTKSALTHARDSLRCLFRPAPSDGRPGRPERLWRLPCFDEEVMQTKANSTILDADEDPLINLDDIDDEFRDMLS